MTRDDLLVTIHQPFPIESMEGKDAVLTQARGCDLLQVFEVPHWLSSGNLLGIYRDGKLIPHDTDIDVNFCLHWGTDETYEKLRGIIYEFQLHDFTLVYSTFLDNHPMQLAFMDNLTGVLFDMYGFYRGIEPRVAINYNYEGIIKKPLRFISKPQTIAFGDSFYPIPNHIEQFLVWRYGADWKTPAKKKVPWQEEATHLEKWK